MKGIDAKVSEERLQEYFSQFGEVTHIVLTEPFEHNGAHNRRCYIKMKDENVVDSIILGPAHFIDGKRIFCVRTFGLDEDK